VKGIVRILQTGCTEAKSPAKRKYGVLLKFPYISGTVVSWVPITEILLLLPFYQNASAVINILTVDNMY
jgi:hypothetical protein